MTARRDHYPRGAVSLLGRATASMPLRARTRHFAAKTVVKRVRPAFRGAGPSRRVFVKVKVVMRTPNARASLKACVRYFGREGAGEEGARAAFFGPHEDRPDAKAEVDRWADDRRHYRIVVNPEDGPFYAGFATTGATLSSAAVMQRTACAAGVRPWRPKS